MTTSNEIPEGLPPMPPLPEGFDRWEYRGEGWMPNKPVRFAYLTDSLKEWNVLDVDHQPVRVNFHYIEAIKSPPASQDVDGYICPHCGGDDSDRNEGNYLHRYCLGCSKEFHAIPDSGGDAPTPRTDAESGGPMNSWQFGSWVKTDFARQLERELAAAEAERDAVMKVAKEQDSALLWAAVEIGKRTRPDPIDKALAAFDALKEGL